ncbi:MAG: hypothetical protein ACREEX_11305 [Caulobacteraceae bacterium]
MKRAALLAGAFALLVGGCAKVGNLERPAPLYGAKAKSQYQAEKAAAAKAAAEKSDEEGAPEPVADPNDPATGSTSVQAPPPPGGPPSPFGPGPSGVMEDPLNHPNGEVSPHP